MTKFRFMIMFCLVLSPVLLTGLDFNFNKYEVPDYTDQDLILDLNSSNDFDNKAGILENNWNGDINSLYFLEKRFNKNDLYLSSYLEYSCNAIDYEDDIYDSLNYQSLNNRFYGSIYTELQHYLIGEIFAGIKTELSGQIYSSDSDNEYPWEKFENHNISESYQEGIKLSVGYGRTNNVSKACKASFILSKLEENGLLARPAENVDLKNLADLLTQLEHIDLFDSRLEKMESYRSIISFLKDHKLINDDNIEIFVIVSDLYELYYPYIRYTGWQIYPEFSYLNTDNIIDCEKEYKYHDEAEVLTNTNDYLKEDESETRMGLNFYYARVFQRDWQIHCSSNFSYFKNKVERKEKSSNYYPEPDSLDSNECFDNEGYQVNGSLELKRYLGTRSVLSSRFAYQYINGEMEQEYSERESLISKNDYTEQELSWVNKISYFINPKLDASLYFYYKLYDKEDSGDEIDFIYHEKDSWNWYIRFGVSYQLF